MMPDWTALDREFALWREAGLTLPFWWRDDDAIEPSPALERLLDLSERSAVPVHLAVIPAHMRPALAEASSAAIILAHGWAHTNHSAPEEKSCEYPDHRVLGERLAETSEGLARLEALFGPRLAPVFVPPWNRMAADMAEGLAMQGYRALSTFGARRAEHAAPGLTRINTHLDPIFWRGTRSLVPTDQLLAQMVADLCARREGRQDNAEPYGLLTHHLVHDDAIWDFTEALLERLGNAPVSQWRADQDLPGGHET